MEMSRTKRSIYSAKFYKAKLARKALKKESTIVDITAQFIFHPKKVIDWKKQVRNRLT
jgi:hypothetical protein